jgi:hypothetical protein
MRPEDLLREATTHLVREMMTSPDEATEPGNHAWHCVGVADGIENIFDRLGYWSVAASQARMNVKSAKLRTIKTAVDAARADAIERDDWTPEDDRQVLVGQIAEQIEGMPIDQLDRVLEAVRGIRC